MASRGAFNAKPPAVFKYLHFYIKISWTNAGHICQPTLNSNCAVRCLPWPRSSHATPNPFLCCSLLVDCKDSVSAMQKELFTVLHGISVAPRYICCSKTPTLPPCLHSADKITNAWLIISLFPHFICRLKSGTSSFIQKSSLPWHVSMYFPLPRDSAKKKNKEARERGNQHEHTA